MILKTKHKYDNSEQAIIVLSKVTYLYPDTRGNDFILDFGGAGVTWSFKTKEDRDKEMFRFHRAILKKPLGEVAYWTDGKEIEKLKEK